MLVNLKKARSFDTGGYGFDESVLKEYLSLKVYSDTRMMFAPEITTPPAGKVYVLSVDDYLGWNYRFNAVQV